MAKKERKKAILDLIRTRRVASQRDLRELLKDRRIEVTQATLSRDMTELKLVKVMGSDGGSHYSLPEGAEQPPPLQILLPTLFVSAECAGNLIVVRTRTGGAQAVGLAIDSQEWSEVLGTIAGDDTVLLVVRDEEGARSIRTRLESIANTRTD